MEDKTLIEKAQQRVDAKKGFYWHAIIFASVSCLFFLMNLFVTGFHNKIWFHFPMIPWGISLLFHGIGVFGIPGINLFSEEWEREALEDELEKLKEERRLQLKEHHEDLLNINEKDYIKLKEWDKHELNS